MTDFDIASAVHAGLDAEIADLARMARRVTDDAAVPALVDECGALVAAGGKRVRPIFAWAGHRAAGGDDAAAVTHAGVAIELVHLCALVHDDIMDVSPLRRGRPTTHLVFQDAHRAAGWAGDAAHFGESAGLLVGDLVLVLADRAFERVAVSAERWRAAFAEFTDMRIEVTLGQWLDLVEGHRRSGDTGVAEAVASLKTSKYTVERPLRIGAALAGADQTLCDALSRYGADVGLAFQLRDDLLGAFGDPAVTGKATGVDFREGKQTALVTRAAQLADDAQAKVLAAALGDPDLDDAGVAAVQEVLVATGAVAECEARIDVLAEQGVAALRTVAIPPAVAEELAQLADRMAHRST